MEEQTRLEKYRESFFRELEDRSGPISEEIKRYLLDDDNLPFLNNVLTYEELTSGLQSGLFDP